MKNLVIEIPEYWFYLILVWFSLEVVNSVLKIWIKIIDCMINKLERNKQTN